jgi:hypothetical protein
MPLSQFEHLLCRLTHRETQKVTHRALEAVVKTEGNELLRCLTQGHFDQRSAEEPIQERMVGEHGISRPHIGAKAGCKRRLGPASGRSPSPAGAMEGGVWTVSFPWMRS